MDVFLCAFHGRPRALFAMKPFSLYPSEYKYRQKS